MPLSFVILVGFWQIILLKPEEIIGNDTINPYSPFMVYTHGGNCFFLLTEIFINNFSYEFISA